MPPLINPWNAVSENFREFHEALFKPSGCESNNLADRSNRERELKEDNKPKEVAREAKQIAEQLKPQMQIPEQS
jgi:hypothetical protein